MKSLRPYQSDLRTDIYNQWQAGVPNVLAVLPTGGGKSVVMSNIAYDNHIAGLNQVIIAHRNELVSQLSLHIAECGINHNIIGSKKTVSQITKTHRETFNGHSFVDPTAICTVGGVDTIMSRKEDLAQWALQVDNWFIDEGHHALKHNKWGTTAALFKNARGLGVTATPKRADGNGLGADFDGIYHSMVQGPTMRQLIDMGSLCEYQIVCPESDLQMDDNQVAASGDWSNKKLKEASEKSRIVGDVVTNYCIYAYSKQAIVFATDVETAGKIARNFQSNGISAAALSGKTPADIREKYIKQFRNGQLKILVNVDLFDEGFDVPACEVVIMARPTASLGKYLQMFGRALRPAPGKAFGLIIDHVSNWLRHGLPDKHREWTLERAEKRSKGIKDPDEIPLKKCTSCTKPYEAFKLACPHCGFVEPLPDPKSRTIDVVQGNLTLLDVEKLAQMRQDTVLEAPGDIAKRVGSVAGDFAGRGQANKQIEKIAAQKELSEAIAMWAGYENHKGVTDEEAYKKFYLTTGEDVLSSLNKDKKRQDYEKLTEKIKSWYN